MPATYEEHREKKLRFQWVKDFRDCVSTEIVKNSFITIGIFVCTDGTEDGEINCLKKNGIAAGTARPAIEQATAVPLAPRADGDKKNPACSKQSVPTESKANPTLLQISTTKMMTTSLLATSLLATSLSLNTVKQYALNDSQLVRTLALERALCLSEVS